MWRKAVGPRERWRGQALAEGEEGTRLAGKSVSPALNWSPSPHLFETICKPLSQILYASKVRELESSKRTSSPKGSD